MSDSYIAIGGEDASQGQGGRASTVSQADALDIAALAAMNETNSRGNVMTSEAEDHLADLPVMKRSLSISINDGARYVGILYASSNTNNRATWHLL